MLGYDYELIYKKGKENVVVDALLGNMRKKVPLCQGINARLDCQGIQEWLANGKVVQIICQLKKDPNNSIGYT